MKANPHVPVAVEALRHWARDPVRFVLDNFSTPKDPLELEQWQVDMLRNAAEAKRSGAAACKGPGKTAVLAWIGWWFLATRPAPKIACTSITGDNLSDGLWSEFAKWQKRSPWLKAAFMWTASRIYLREQPETWFIAARSWPQSGNTDQMANTLAGFHADHVLFLVDEVSDIPDAVIGAAEGALTSGKETRLVIAGNCTRTDGTLWRAAEGPERHLWRIVRVTGDPDNPRRSKRINIEEARVQIEKYGRESYIAKVNILGEFPDRQADKLLDVRDVETAMRRTVPPAVVDGQAKVIGADVARFGDDKSVFAPRQGRMVYGLKEFTGLSTTELGDQLIRSLEKWGAHASAVDETGVGAGTVDHCNNRGYASRVRGIQFGMKAQEPERFENRRAEMWWRCAEWVKNGGGCLPMDRQLAEELCAPIYWFDRRGRVCVESTDDIKRKIGRSPDRASAVILTFAEEWGPAADLDAIGGGPFMAEVTDDSPSFMADVPSSNPWERSF